MSNFVTCPQCGVQLAAGTRFCASCGRSMTMVVGAGPQGLDALVGQVIAGRYRVLDKLGQGGMGTVFRAEQVSVRRQIALKVLDPTLSFEPELMKRFEAEAEVAARLSHPNTVTLFDFGRDETGRLYIAMELAAGKSLRDVLSREAPFHPARAVHIMEQIASSLADAHDHGIVHRDMKPDNVILSERAGVSDFARVLDFGIAKLYDTTSTLAQGREQMTRAGQILGTPQYMSPEQIAGAAIDGRTDIYALGMMFYEMLTARLPFNAPTVMALLAMHQYEPPRPVLDWRPDLPPPLAALVMRCLEKHPNGRPRDMRAFLAELASLRPYLGMATPTPGYGTPVPAYGVPATPYPAPTPQPGYGTPAPPQYRTPASPPGYGAPAPYPATPPPAAYPASTPAPLVPAPPPPFITAPPAPRKGSKAGVWAAVVVGVVVAGVTAAVLVLRSSSGGGDETTSSSLTSETPSVETTPTVPNKKFQSGRFGYALDLPASIEMHEDQGSGNAIGGGYIDGQQVAVMVVPAMMTDEDTLATALLSGSGGSARLVEKRTRHIRGDDVVSIVYEVPGTGRYESCLMPGSQPLLVTFGAAPDAFDKLAAFRDSLFRDRLQLK